MKPCENTERFESLEKSVTSVVAITEASARQQASAAEDHKVLAGEMRGFMNEIRERTVRTDQRTEAHHESLRVLFQRMRKVEDTDLPAIRDNISQAKNAAEVRSRSIETDIEKLTASRIMPIEIKHLKEEGAAAALKDIRVIVPSLLAIGLALINLWEKVGPWLSKAIR